MKTLCSNLSKYYWSPQPPATYVFKEGTSVKGIGVIAHQNFAAFNLAWASTGGKWETVEAQKLLVSSFSDCRALTLYPMGGQTVGDWVCMLQPTDFLKQLSLTSLAGGYASANQHLRVLAEKGAQLESAFNL